MKRLVIVMLLAVICLTGRAQHKKFNQEAVIPSYRLDITWHKTTMLIFPAAIQSADRGDSYVLAEKVKGAENVLKVKAGKKDFAQSNLSVITEDGKLYSFTINYSENPHCQAIDLRKQPPFAPVQFKGLSLNSQQIRDYADMVAHARRFIRGAKNVRYGITFQLQGIFIKEDVLFFSFYLENGSAIPYDIGSLRFYIRDKKQAKRTAIQNKEVQPLHYGYSHQVVPGSGQTIVVAFGKFTMAEGKRFAVELMEDRGDRNLSLKINQRKLKKVKALHNLDFQ